MKTYKREARFSELKNYCHLSKPHEYMEVCEWANGEGFDVAIGDTHFQLTWGQFNLLQVLALSKND